MCHEVASSVVHLGHIAPCANVVAHDRPSVDRQRLQADLALGPWRGGEPNLHGMRALAPGQRALGVGLDRRRRLGRRFRQRRAPGGGEAVPGPPVQVGPADQPAAHHRRNRPLLKFRQQATIGAPGLVIAARGPERRRARQRPLGRPPRPEVNHRGRLVIARRQPLADLPTRQPAWCTGQ